MRDYISIGSSPCEEDCAQVGSPDYEKSSRKECKAYLNQIRREFGEEPPGAILRIKAFPHDFGTYHEVVCVFDDNDEEATEYAFQCECPSSTWDEEALKELKGEMNDSL
jgi:hypothetical protein